jgi:putative lipoprotein (rSAM/lipoprotein system)
MKKLHHSLLKYFNALLVVLLGLFGFSSCEKCDIEEYSIPTGDFIVKGKVINKANGEPVSGIRVSRRWIGIGLMYGTPMPEFNDKSPVFSDKDGNFLTALDNPFSFALEFRDVDGAKNGLFNDTTIFVQFDEGKHILNLDVEMRPKNK